MSCTDGSLSPFAFYCRGRAVALAAAPSARATFRGADRSAVAQIRTAPAWPEREPR